MTRIVNLSRRNFMVGSGAVAGALVLGFAMPDARAQNTAETAEPEAINSFVLLSADGMTTVMLNKSEMGQGSFTGVAMLIADEMDADWSRIKVETITEPHRQDYWTPSYGGVGTGGSRTIRESWMTYRRAGAAARAMLVEAAARHWKVPAERLRTEPGYVIDPEADRQLAYGDLVGEAIKLQPPAEPNLKDPRQWRMIGQVVEQLDIPLKVDGSAIYGMDVRLPDQLVAAVRQCPRPGGTIAALNDTEARSMPGVVAVVREEGFVAVVADNTWQAQRALNMLQVDWTDPPISDEDTSAMMARLRASFDGDHTNVQDEGDTEQALAYAAQVVEAEYEVPLIAHACMEPMNCTAMVDGDHCSIWGPLQNQGWAQGVGSMIADVPLENVTVHTTFLGGGFGRKFQVDFVVQAVLVAKAVPGRPVKTVWSREEDFAQGFFRPAAVHRIRAAVDGDGKITGWDHKLAQPSILHRWVVDGDVDQTPVEKLAAQGMPQPMAERRKRSVAMHDPSIPASIANKTYYDIAARKLDLTRPRSNIPAGIWRSVGSSGNAFVFESMIDEIAVATGEDPFRFRQDLLKASPRHLAVLERAAANAGWTQQPAQGRFRGIALDESFGGIAAYVVEVSVSDAGLPRVHHVHAVLDCGVVVNRGAAEAQVEGAVMQGLSAALGEEINLESGQVVENNFDRYRVMTLAEAPQVNVELMESDAAPGGVGEPAVPAIAPALCNAIHAATGRRLRSLPVSRHDLRRA